MNIAGAFCPTCGAKLQIGFGTLGRGGYGEYRFCFNHNVWPWCSFVAKGLGEFGSTEKQTT